MSDSKVLLPSRRRFLFGLGVSLIAAPAIVRVAANLMPVSSRAEWIAPFHVRATGSDWNIGLSGHFRSAEEAIDRTVRWARESGYNFDVVWARTGPFARGIATPEFPPLTAFSSTRAPAGLAP